MVIPGDAHLPRAVMLTARKFWLGALVFVFAGIAQAQPRSDDCGHAFTFVADYVERNYAGFQSNVLGDLSGVPIPPGVLYGVEWLQEQLR